jgi:hypothetical protein
MIAWGIGEMAKLLCESGPGTRRARREPWCRRASTDQLVQAARRRRIATDLVLVLLVIATLAWVARSIA